MSWSNALFVNPKCVLKNISQNWLRSIEKAIVFEKTKYAPCCLASCFGICGHHNTLGIPHFAYESSGGFADSDRRAVIADLSLAELSKRLGEPTILFEPCHKENDKIGFSVKVKDKSINDARVICN